MLVLSLILACAGPEEELPDLSLDDIREQYRIVDSLNARIYSNQLDTSGIDRYVVLGRDVRNDGIVIRRGEKRMVGCIMFRTLFGLFYEDCDSSACNGIGGIKVIDYQGYAGVPYYVGCAPDTSS